MAIYTGKTNMIDKVVVVKDGAPSEEMDYVYVTNAAGKRELVFEQKPPAPDDNTQEAVPVKTKWTASLTGFKGLRRPYPSGAVPTITYIPTGEMDTAHEFRLTGSPIIRKKYPASNNTKYSYWGLFRDENVVIIHEKQRTIQPNRLYNYATNTDQGKAPKPYYPADSELYDYYYGGIMGMGGSSGKGPTYYVFDASYAKVGEVMAFLSIPAHTIMEAPKVISLDKTGYSGLDIITNYYGTSVRTYCGINITKTSKLHYMSITSRITVKEGSNPQQVYSNFYSINLKINEEGKEGVEPSSMVTTQGVVYPYNNDRKMIGLGSGQLHLNIKETK